MGITSQLSSTFKSINMSGFKFGTGDNALLLGTNVIGSIVAWGLMAITLLENPFAAQLSQVVVKSCNLLGKGLAGFLLYPASMPDSVPLFSSDCAIAWTGGNTATWNIPISSLGLWAIQVISNLREEAMKRGDLCNSLPAGVYPRE